MIELNDITIKLTDNGDIWLSRPSGEGMSVDREEFEAMLIEFYSENF